MKNEQKKFWLFNCIMILSMLLQNLIFKESIFSNAQLQFS